MQGTIQERLVYPDITEGVLSPEPKDMEGFVVNHSPDGTMTTSDGKMYHTGKWVLCLDLELQIFRNMAQLWLRGLTWQGIGSGRSKMQLFLLDCP